MSGMRLSVVIPKMNYPSFLLEFKVIELTESGSALAQIKEKKYYEKYISSEVNEIYLVGVEFSRDSRNIVKYEYEIFQ